MNTNTLTIKNSWDEITWREYEQIEQILNTDIPESYKSVHLLSILTGVPAEDIEDMPIATVQKLIPHLDFLYTEPETHAHQFEYTVNDREYDFKGKLDEITTAQYIDYRSYMEEENKDVVKLMSVFLIPKGHEYNDGYDMGQVQSDIGDMCWLDVRAAAFFFRIQFSAFILILKSYLAKTMKKAKAKKPEIKQLKDHLDNMAYSLLYSESASTAIQPLTL
jgi:hypothetical protein